MDKPLISIITPAYNAMPFLKRAIASSESFLADGMVEHIVFDAESSDGSREFLAQTGAKWISEPDNGQSDALNKALAKARGQWIAWLNADEFYLDGVLATMVEELPGERSDVVFGDFVEIDTSGHLLRYVAQHKLSARVLRVYGGNVPSCSTFIRRQSILDAGGWNIDNRTMMDWELWWSLYRNGCAFRYTGKPHAAFTRHPDQATVRLVELSSAEKIKLNSKFNLDQGLQSVATAFLLRGIYKFLNGGYIRTIRGFIARGSVVS